MTLRSSLYLAQITDQSAQLPSTPRGSQQYGSFQRPLHSLISLQQLCYYVGEYHRHLVQLADVHSYKPSFSRR